MLGRGGELRKKKWINAPISQNQRSIVSSLLDGIVPLASNIIRTTRQNRKLLIHIAIQKRQQRNDRQGHIGDKRCNDFRKRIRDTKAHPVSPTVTSRNEDQKHSH